MTEGEGLECLRRMLLACQKVRSNTYESLTGRLDGFQDHPELSMERWADETTEGRIAARLNPWLFGPGGVLPKLEEILHNGRIDPGGFRNLMWVAHHESLEAPLEAVLALWGYPSLPSPSLEETAVGWD